MMDQTLPTGRCGHQARKRTTSVLAVTAYLFVLPKRLGSATLAHERTIRQYARTPLSPFRLKRGLFAPLRFACIDASIGRAEELKTRSPGERCPIIPPRKIYSPKYIYNIVITWFNLTYQNVTRRVEFLRWGLPVN